MVAEAALALLSYGPVVTDVGDTRATIWTRLDQCPAAVELATSAGHTATAAAEPSSDCTVRLDLVGLEPDRAYDYRVIVDGVAHGPYYVRTRPTREDTLVVALFADGFENRACPSLATAMQHLPDVAIILGDWPHGDPAGLNGMREMHRQTVSGLTKLGRDVRATLIAAGVPTYRTWDDHDYCGPNQDASCSWRRQALRAWSEYRPLPADHGYPAGIWHRVDFGLAEFFLLDVRSHRVKGVTMLGPAQLAWLEDRLGRSTATWKVVVTPVPFNRTVNKVGDSWEGFPAERAAVAGLLRGTPGALLVSGDLHLGGAIDDGRNSAVPELNVPMANRGFGPTGGGKWSVGRVGSLPGFGLLHLSAQRATISAYGFDGPLRLQYRLEAPDAPAAVAP